MDMASVVSSVFSWGLRLFRLALWIAGKLFYVFTRYIDLCNFALVAFIGWLVCTQRLHWHNVPSILVGLVLGGLLHWLFKTKVGFWIVSPIFSALWTWLFMEVFFKSHTAKLDSIWYWTIAILLFGFTMLRHNGAIWRAELDAEEEAERLAKQSSPY